MKSENIDKDVLEYMAGLPLSTKDGIASALKISDRTLLRYIQSEYGCDFVTFKQVQREKLGTKIINKQLELALNGKGNAQLLIWLGKQYAGQTDRQEIKTEVEFSLADQIAKARARLNSVQEHPNQF